MMKQNFKLLTFVTHKGKEPTDPYLGLIDACINAGLTCVQLREKSLSCEDRFDFARALKRFLDSKNIPLIINDDVDLCLRLDASGVHLGQSDGDVAKARSVLGSNKIIGLTVNNLQQVQNSCQKPIDYLGVGPIFPTHHKADVETIWGLKGLKETTLMTSHPIVAIGGIDENNAFSVMDAGADGIAAIGALHQAKDPYIATKNLIKIIKERQNDRCHRTSSC